MDPIDADDASDGADASDAGDPRLILSTHRALDAIGGFANPSEIRALHVVSKTVRDSRLLVAIKRAVTTRCTAHAASKRARRRLEAVDAMGRFLGPGAEGFLSAIFRDDKLQTVRAAAATWLARVARHAGPVTKQERERPRPRPRQLAGHQGLRRGQLDRAGGSREESLPSSLNHLPYSFPRP